MATLIIPKKSTVADKVPLVGDLSIGELAVNLTDLKIYSKDGAGAIVNLTNYVDIDYAAFDLTSTHVVGEGELAWDADNGTLDLGLGGGVINQLGQENMIYAKAIEALTDGEVVYISGSTGASGKLEVSKYIANNVTTPSLTLGIATEDIAIGEFGHITVFGAVRGIPTDGTAQGETWLAGDLIYASPTVSGGLTKAEPIAPNPQVQIAIVLNVNATNGSIFVRAHSTGLRLDELHNVKATGPSDNDLLGWDNANSRWENRTIAEAGLATAAQGTKADNALPTTGGALTGNLTTTGLIDGVDIAETIPATLGTAGQVIKVNTGGTAGEWVDTPKITVSSTAPASPAVDDLWVDTT
jgi:hypothetical protein